MKTALVKNPSQRSLSVSGGKVSTAKKNPKPQANKNKNTKKTTTVKKTTAKKNPATPKVVYKYRAKSNPINTIWGLLSAALFAGVSVATFDFVTSKLLPPSVGAPVRIGIKGLSGAAFAQWGGRVPVIGAYSKEIGLVLITLAIVDGIQTYALPIVNDTVNQFRQPALLSSSNADAELAYDDWDNDDYEDDYEDDYDYDYDYEAAYV